MMRTNEVDLLEAMDMLDVPEEILGKLFEEGKLKSRRANGTIYFLRDEIDELHRPRDGGSPVEGRFVMVPKYAFRETEQSYRAGAVCQHCGAALEVSSRLLMASDRLSVQPRGDPQLSLLSPMRRVDAGA